MSDHKNDKAQTKHESPDRVKDHAEKKSHHEANMDMHSHTEAQTKHHREEMRKRADGQDTKSGTSKLLGTPEITGLIKGKAPESAKSHKDANDSSDKSHEKPEKLIPKDGDSIKLQDLLTKYKTPFIDAYERSKQLKDGEPGKSETLEDVVQRLKDCPWLDQIQVKFDSKASNPEYKNSDSTITIRPQEPAWQQIDTFAHEGFHATHQTLIDLFGGKQPASLTDFVRIKGNAEVGAFETEAQVHTELGSPGKVLYSDWKNSQMIPQPDKDLGELYANGGREALSKFILFDAFTKMDIHGKIQDSNYHKYHESAYDKYLSGFPQAKKSLDDWFKRDPSAEKKIKQGGF